MKTRTKIMILTLTLALALALCTAACAEEHQHHWVRDTAGWQEATCTHGARHAYYCDRPDCTTPDGAEESFTAGEADWIGGGTVPGPLPHEKDEGTEVGPTCTEPGKITYKCTNCGAAMPEATVITSEALGHNMVKDDTSWKEPTCTEPGRHEYYCNRCNDYNYTYPDGHGSTMDEIAHVDLKPTGHSFTEEGWKQTLAPTCVTAGKKERLCTKCKGELEGGKEEEEIDALGHTYDREGDPSAEGTVDFPADCTNDGQKTVTCGDCGTSEQRTIPATGHTWGEWETTKKATTSSKGEKERKCSVCGEIETQEIAKLKSSSSSSSKKSSSSQPVATDEPILPYGSIVSDADRADEEYAAEIVEEPIEGTEDVNHVLTITAEPDETGAYVLRNLHITDALLAQMSKDHIELVRFIVGDAIVEFPAANFTGDAIEAVKADLDSPAVAYIVTVDPTAVTEDGNPGVEVSVSVACEDATESDITPVVSEGMTLTVNGAAQPVTAKAVYPVA